MSRRSTGRTSGATRRATASPASTGGGIKTSTDKAVLAEFDIGEAVQLDTVEVFSKQLERFVNTFKSKEDQYKNGLLGANGKYSQENLLKNITHILR